MDHIKKQERTVNTSARLALLTALCLTPIAQADEFGRLFFTPAERDQLDQQLARQAVNEDGSSAQAYITVNGIIKRSDGSRIVWINGKSQLLAPGGNPNRVPVNVPGKSKPVEMKVGQRIMLDNPAPSKAPSKNSLRVDD